MDASGLKDMKGYYHVESFEVNGKTLPYNPSDSIRWHDAIFEDWSTLSYKTNRTALVDRMIGYSPLRVKGDRKNSTLNQVNTQDSDALFKKQLNRDLGVTRWEVGGMAEDPILGRWQRLQKTPDGNMDLMFVFRADSTYDGIVNGKAFINGRYFIKNDTMSIADNSCNVAYYGTYKLKFFVRKPLHQLWFLS